MATGFNQRDSVIVWEWTDDQGEWMPYEARVSNFIEDNLTSSVIQLGDVDRLFASLSVNTAKMVQTSRSGMERPIRRSTYDGNSAAANCATWKWAGDHRRWLSYSSEVANVLESSFHLNKTGYVDLGNPPCNLPYVVDFNRMEQINKKTGFPRTVRREQTLGARYKTVANGNGRTTQSWQQYLGNRLPPGGGSAGLSTAAFGPSQPGVGKGFVFGQSTNAASASGFTLSMSTPFTGGGGGGGPSVFSGGSAATASATGTGATSPPVQPSSSTATAGRPKRIRALRKNLTPGFSTSPPPSSFTSPLTSTNSGANPGAFTAWRSQSSSSGLNTSPLSPSQLPSSFISPGSVVASSSGSSNSSTSQSSNGSIYPLLSPLSSATGAISSLVTGLSGMVLSTYRAVSTRGFWNQATVSPVAATGTGASSTVVASSSAPALVYSSASKSGARTKTRGYASSKRLKVPGDTWTNVAQDDLSYVQKLTARDVLRCYIKPVPKAPANEDCCICCDSLQEASGYGQGTSYEVIQLNKCSHMFHSDCIAAMYDSSSKNGSIQCPSCKMLYGIKCGNCPDGKMEFQVINRDLPGYSGCSTIEIMYTINNGTQTEVHPNPNRPYKVRGFPRLGYLPNNQEGQKVLELLVTAWKRRLTFTIGTSVTTGEDDVIVWNEIHHKTEMTNASGHGYPDPKYLGNVTAELAAQGVTEDDE